MIRRIWRWLRPPHGVSSWDGYAERCTCGYYSRDDYMRLGHLLDVAIEKANRR